MPTGPEPPSDGAGLFGVSDLLTVRVEARADAAVIRVAGEIDLHTVGALRDALQHTVVEGARLVVVDLEHVRFMGSTGVTQLLAALAQARVVGCELRLAAAGRAVRTPMRLTGTDEHFEHYATVDEAIRQPLVGL